MPDYSNLMAQVQSTSNPEEPLIQNQEMPELLCEHSIRNKILTKLFHVEKASKRHSEKQMLWKIATSLKS